MRMVNNSTPQQARDEQSHGVANEYKALCFPSLPHRSHTKGFCYRVPNIQTRT